MKAALFLGLLGVLSASAVEIEWVTVGDPGNLPDKTGYGGVPYAYQIGKYEVSVEQYAEFLNAVAGSDPHGLWDERMGDAGARKAHTTFLQRTGDKGAYRYEVLPGCERLPVVFVSFEDAMRFANWLHNGKGQGDTETGAYSLAESGDTQEKEARVWVATEDEWYKAAYYQPPAQGGPEGGYWLYPTRSDEPPALAREGGPLPNSASFMDFTLHRADYGFLIPVGSHPNAPSFYGTFDQGGSVWEWNAGRGYQNKRILRGGSVTKPSQGLRSVMRITGSPGIQQADVGFRLARPLPVPPAGALMADVRAGMEPLLDAHCYDCHEGKTKKGGLDLAALPWNPGDEANLQAWIGVFDRVKNGEMPPKKKPRPPEPLVARSTQALGAALHGVTRVRQETEGRAVVRRLNRAEYIQTVRDLFDVNSPLEDLLPRDGLEAGFDTVGAALQISPSHLEAYLEAAERVLRAATVDRPRPTEKKVRLDLSEQWLTHAAVGQHHWSYSPEGFLAVRNLRESGFQNLLLWSPEVLDARYRFRVRARAMLDDKEQWGGGGKSPDRRSSSRPGQSGAVLNNRWPKGGQDPRITVALSLGSAKWINSQFRYFEASPTEFREFAYETRVPAGQTLRIAPHRILPEAPGELGGVFHGMCVVVEHVEVEGPLFEQWPPRGHQLLYGDLPLQPDRGSGKMRVTSGQPSADAGKLLANLLPKLFRRPVPEAERDEYLDLFLEHHSRGVPFDEALLEAYKLALCSPEFLLRRENPGPLGDHALATRLSYGLWGTAPDAALQRLADEGRLRDAATFKTQIARLLADDRAGRFYRGFLGNWLNLREIDATQPDRRLFSEFDDHLQQSMLAEAEAFLRELVENNLSVTHVVQSDFAMLNERLAEHYGIDGVRGDTLRKVPLPPNSRRGGFLTQGAVLKVSANGTVTSPVVRGAYVLERILGITPPRPPESVPAIEPDIRGASTIREQLEKHRQDASCAVCHVRMDPPGFALENYDVTGRWRENYRVLSRDKLGRRTQPGGPYVLYDEGPKVLPGYQLEDGRVFADIDGLKDLLVANPEDLARSLVMKFATQLTGARVQFADREVVEDIVQRARADGYGVRTLLEEVLASRLFTHK
jgi:formylglycine-generating enzyme required for sulfatase activity